MGIQKCYYIALLSTLTVECTIYDQKLQGNLIANLFSIIPITLLITNIKAIKDE